MTDGSIADKNNKKRGKVDPVNRGEVAGGHVIGSSVNFRGGGGAAIKRWTDGLRGGGLSVNFSPGDGEGMIPLRKCVQEERSKGGFENAIGHHRNQLNSPFQCFL